MGHELGKTTILLLLLLLLFFLILSLNYNIIIKLVFMSIVICKISTFLWYDIVLLELTIVLLAKMDKNYKV